MKILKKAAFVIAGVTTLMAPLSLGAVAYAQQATTPLKCSFRGSEEFPEGACDLAVDKLVSVNGGAFVEADTSADAAQAQVGDTITWKIILTNESSDGFTPYGWAHVKDLLPSGVSYVSSSATIGVYNTSGSFVNEWTVPLANSDGFSNLPATLTIVSTSTATGLFQNTAELTGYEYPFGPDGAVPYQDDNDSNDSNDAWIDPSGKPVVLADSTTTSGTLANTGDNTLASAIAGGLIVVAALTVNFANRKQAYKLNR